MEKTQFFNHISCTPENTNLGIMGELLNNINTEKSKKALSDFINAQSIQFNHVDLKQYVDKVFKNSDTKESTL